MTTKDEINSLQDKFKKIKLNDKIADILNKYELDDECIEKIKSVKSFKQKKILIESLKDTILENDFNDLISKLSYRSFTIVVSKIISDDIDTNKLKTNNSDYYGRYLGYSPNQASKKAFTKICNKCKVAKECTIIFSIKETTRNSNKNIFNYVGKNSFNPKYIITSQVADKRKVVYSKNFDEFEEILEDGVLMIRRKIPNDTNEKIFKISFSSKVVANRM